METGGVLDKAKAWFNETYEQPVTEPVDDYEDDEVPYLARLSTCSDLIPGSAMTYADAVADIAFTYFDEYSDGDEKKYAGCDVYSSDSGGYDTCSQCGQSIEGPTFVGTQDRALAAKYGLPYLTTKDLKGLGVQTERDGSEGSIVLYLDGVPFTDYDENGAEYDTGEELDEAGIAAYVEARRRAEERAIEEAAESVRRGQAAWEAARIGRIAEVPTLDVHPYLKRRALDVLNVGAAPSYYCGFAGNGASGSDMFAAVNVILDGGIGEVTLDGKTWAIWTNGIGGAKVDHLREGGRIAASEGERKWDDVAKKYYTEGRTFMRPSELFDALVAAQA